MIDLDRIITAVLFTFGRISYKKTNDNCTPLQLSMRTVEDFTSWGPSIITGERCWSYLKLRQATPSLRFKSFYFVFVQNSYTFFSLSSRLTSFTSLFCIIVTTSCPDRSPRGQAFNSRSWDDNFSLTSQFIPALEHCL